MQYPIKRTPEEGHSPACWTKAITAALENQRDYFAEHNTNSAETEYHFRLWLQDNGPLTMAEDLLATGTTTCLCDPISLTNVFDQIQHFGEEE